MSGDRRRSDFDPIVNVHGAAERLCEVLALAGERLVYRRWAERTGTRLTKVWRALPAHAPVWNQRNPMGYERWHSTSSHRFKRAEIRVTEYVGRHGGWIDWVPEECDFSALQSLWKLGASYYIHPGADGKPLRLIVTIPNHDLQAYGQVAQFRCAECGRTDRKQDVDFKSYCVDCLAWIPF